MSTVDEIMEMGPTQKALEAAVALLNPNRLSLIGSHLMYTYEYEDELYAHSQAVVTSETIMLARSISDGPILMLTLDASENGSSWTLLWLIKEDKWFFCPSGMNGPKLTVNDISQFQLEEV